MKRLFYYLPLIVGGFLLLNACGDPADVGNHDITDGLTDDVQLHPGDIFDGEKVFAYLKNKTKFLTEANALFFKGINSFKNNDDLDSAEYYLSTSITKEPTGKAYYELGNVLKELELYDEAMSSYKLAEQLDYAPFSNLLYKMASVFSLQEEDEKASQYLEYALQAGFNDIDKLEKDNDFDYLRTESHWSYTRAIKKGLDGMSDPDKLFWLQFKKQFVKIDLPYKLKWKMSDKEDASLEFISYDFERFIPEMRDEKFSREVSKGFYYFAEPMETETFVALIYIVKDEFMGPYAPLEYRLATFTHEGKLIDKKTIAGSTHMDDHIMVTEIEADGGISIQYHNAKYEKDPDEFGYWENPISLGGVVDAGRYEITASGKMVDIDVEPISALGDE